MMPALLCGSAHRVAANFTLHHLVSGQVAQISLLKLAPRRYGINNFVMVHPVKACDASDTSPNWP